MKKAILILSVFIIGTLGLSAQKSNRKMENHR